MKNFRGRFICRDTGVSLSSGKACNHYAHCPCGEACLGPAGNPITSNFPTASARWGTCTRVKCGKDKEGNNFECSHFGFDAKYVCSDEKVKNFCSLHINDKSSMHTRLFYDRNKKYLFVRLVCHHKRPFLRLPILEFNLVVVLAEELVTTT